MSAMKRTVSGDAASPLADQPTAPSFAPGYLALVLLGTAVPLYYIAQFFSQPSPGAVQVAAGHNPVALVFIADVFISTVVFWVFLAAEQQRQAIAKPWLVATIVANVCIGLSAALPLFLYVRSHRDR